MEDYDRRNTYRNRGRVTVQAGNDSPATYDGYVKVLVESLTAGTWVETDVDIMLNVFEDEEFPGRNIHGFNGMADDDLRVIEYIHTYQIPGLR